MGRTIRVALLAAATSCATAPPTPSPTVPAVPAGITFAGGNGLDCKTRIKVLGANYETGVSAEYAWLQAKYPGFERGRQTLVECEGKDSDKLDIVTAEGKELTLYFDVSDFMGKGLVR
jgi:hypothetical protein